MQARNLWLGRTEDACLGGRAVVCGRFRSVCLVLFGQRAPRPCRADQPAYGSPKRPLLAGATAAPWAGGI